MTQTIVSPSLSQLCSTFFLHFPVIVSLCMEMKQSNLNHTIYTHQLNQIQLYNPVCFHLFEYFDRMVRFPILHNTNMTTTTSIFVLKRWWPFKIFEISISLAPFKRLYRCHEMNSSVRAKPINVQPICLLIIIV